ncbi:hypothetical protein GIB67_030526 [Kingdonia uniflora]|uniref:Uncharacterized protein n=1 Tax=Kingdonia uniflora TaxID=39325 RepID=A0A7J7M9R0_9MAGN|nr:hypothetical protein GIB67_030526 [Kingdonia uniflora]
MIVIGLAIDYWILGRDINFWLMYLDKEYRLLQTAKWLTNLRTAVASQILESFSILRKVEAQTETELKEKKLRVEDALNATTAAIEEGIVVGGGCTLLRLAIKVDAIKLTLDNDEQMVGADIVKRALSYPLKLIAKNVGDNGSDVMEKVLSSDNFKYGYNTATGKYKDLMVVGIIDPTKVCWVFQKIGSHDDKGLQRYLDNVQYKCINALVYCVTNGSLNMVL